MRRGLTAVSRLLVMMKNLEQFESSTLRYA